MLQSSRNVLGLKVWALVVTQLSNGGGLVKMNTVEVFVTNLGAKSSPVSEITVTTCMYLMRTLLCTALQMQYYHFSSCTVQLTVQ